MRRTVAIAGHESEYWVKLMEYMNRKGQFETFVCTREEALEEELKKRKPILLFREQGFAEKTAFEGQEVFFVSSRTEAEGIYLYQPAEEIYKEMLQYIPKEQIFVEARASKEKRICAVYSPLGRSGKTSFALAYAKKHSFFYIGLEEYGLAGENKNGMSEILYHIHNQKEEIVATMLEKSEYWEEVHMLGSPLLFQDVKQICMEDYTWFFEKLRKDAAIPSVIVDLGTGCLSDFEMFDLFDQIYIPVLDGEIEQKKMKYFWSLFREMYGEISERFRMIRVPAGDWKNEVFLDYVKERSYREEYSFS